VLSSSGAFEHFIFSSSAPLSPRFPSSVPSSPRLPSSAPLSPRFSSSAPLSPRFLPSSAPLSPRFPSSAPLSPHFLPRVPLSTCFSFGCAFEPLIFLFFYTWVGHPSQWDHF
jgi:hypothetical protein